VFAFYLLHILLANFMLLASKWRSMLSAIRVKATDSEWLQCFQPKPHPYACQTHKLKLFQYDGQLHATANGDYANIAPHFI